MATADELVDQIYSWIEQRERCAYKLRDLARELESRRRSCNASETVGSTVAVAGAACFIGAGIATFLTGGLAAPFLAALGTAYTGVGVTTSLVTKITEHFLSSASMTEAQNAEKESRKTAETIEQLFLELRTKNDHITDPDDQDKQILTEILKTIARRNHIKIDEEIILMHLSEEPGSLDFLNIGLRKPQTKLIFLTFVAVLRFFSFVPSGMVLTKELKRLPVIGFKVG